MPRGVVEPAIRADPQLLRRNRFQRKADAIGYLDGRLRIVGFHVNHADRQLAIGGELSPETDLGHLPIRELEDKLIDLRLEQAREDAPVRAAGSGTAVEIPEADVDGDL